MKTHFDNLVFHIPDLANRDILDVGSGKGSFLIQAATKGARAYGIEYNPENVLISKGRAVNNSVSITVEQGDAERLPFGGESFDFVNIGEVIEHVDNPDSLLREVFRVLRPGGLVYLSVPNRFGLKDQHFHLLFLNWMPRSWAYWIIGLLGKHKDYSGKSGRQDIRDMNYYTYTKIKNILTDIGFGVEDMRLKKFGFLYVPLRYFILDSFHLLLSKKTW